MKILQCLSCYRTRVLRSRGLCGSCYNRLWAADDLPDIDARGGSVDEYREKFKASRMRRTKVDTVTGCWVWNGLRTDKGYGVSCFRSKQAFLHRASFEVFCEAIKPGNIVRHRCDNPPCWNPDHLVQGTHADNEADKGERGRRPLGSEVYNAKLTEADVLKIRASKETNAVLSARYGIAAPNISSIRNRKIWKHV